MRRATVVIGIAGAAVVGWIVAPVVDLARRGTRDQRSVCAWRRHEGRTWRRKTAADARIPDPRRPDEPTTPAVQGRTGAP
jgi:hypothetical protein